LLKYSISTALILEDLIQQSLFSLSSSSILSSDSSFKQSTLAFIDFYSGQELSYKQVKLSCKSLIQQIQKGYTNSHISLPNNPYQHLFETNDNEKIMDIDDPISPNESLPKKKRQMAEDADDLDPDFLDCKKPKCFH
jgi:hypothetical protein